MPLLRSIFATIAAAAAAAVVATEPAPAVTAPAPPQIAPLVVDAVVRYVNEASITGNEVVDRVLERLADVRRRGLALPQTRAEHLALVEQALDELTEEHLLLQKATELKIALDRDRISAEVLAIARREGRAMSLRDQAETRRYLERSRTIDIVLQFFEERAAQPTPADLRAEFDRRTDAFRRPAQATVLQIALPIAGVEDDRRLRTDRAGLVRQAQSAADPAITAAAADCLAAFLDAEPAEQDRLLGVAVVAIAARAGTPGLAPADAELAAAATSLVARAGALRTAEQAETDLRAVAAAMAGSPDPTAAFTAAAARLGAAVPAPLLVEPGLYAPAVDAAVFQRPLGSPGEPLRLAGQVVLLLVTDRQEGRSLSFDEVVGDLEQGRARLRRGLVRTAVVDALRARAVVRPGLMAVDALLR
jgi:parvulin-like peptidyl-prolyl isomerase